MVQNIDIAPTILASAGLEKPDYMPGESFLPLLAGESPNWRSRIYYEYYWEYDFPMTPTVYGVRTDTFKFIRYHGVWDQNELYNLIEDPEEMVNLMGKAAYDSIARTLCSDLFDWLENSDGMQIPIKRTVKHPFGDYRHPLQY